MSKVSQVLAGYVFDGLVFQRAAVDRKTLEIVNKETRQPVGGTPSLLLWYTRREFQNAIARLEAAKKVQGLGGLIVVTPTPDLMTELKRSASIRLTRDHILHMLTAGVEKARGAKFTDVEIKAYEAEADAMTQELDDAVLPAVVLKSA